MFAGPMRRVATRNLVAHKVRLILTLLSVMLGTAFVAGSFVFTDSLQGTFDDIFAGEARGVDVRVQPMARQSLGLPEEVIGKIAAMDGVRAVAPGVSGPVVLLRDGKAIQTAGTPVTGIAYLRPGEAVGAPERFLTGTPPVRAGQIAIDRTGAERAGLRAGDRTTVLIPSAGSVDVTVSGVYDLPTSGAGGITVLFDDAQARSLFTDGRHVAYADIAARPGGDADRLRTELSRAFPQYAVLSGDQVRREMAKDVADRLKFVDYFLLAFGAVAVLVGAFIIYNTFSMLIAQRLRELALLRAIGADRGQVGRSVLSEAMIIGLIGSALGLLCGVGLAFGVCALLNAANFGLPSGAMSVRPRTIAVTLLLGVAVTVVSAYSPARRAVRVAPVEAMRAGHGSVAESLRPRAIAGTVLAIVGAALIGTGAYHVGATAALIVGIGTAAMIFAALFTAPALSRPVVRGLGVLLRPFGPIGRMSRNNALRHPRRTAATAFALMLGLLLVTSTGILDASAKSGINELVDKGVKADYLLAGPPAVGLPPAVAAAAQRVPGVRSMVSLRTVGVWIGSEQLTGTVAEGPLHDVLDYTIEQGTERLGGNGVMVSETEASEHHWKLADTIELTSADRRTYPLIVDGIYKDTRLLGPLVAPPAFYDKAVPVSLRTDYLVLLTARPGTDSTALRSGLESAMRPYPIVQVQNHNEFKGSQGAQIDAMVAILYGLLALSVVIAVLGIANTLALSVTERRREIGMLRAVGMRRAQVRRTIYLESGLIAIFGALIGVGLGIGVGVAFLRTLRDFGLVEIAVPWGQLAATLPVAGVVGVLAAVWPAIRASRTSPLAAIADE